MNADRTASIRRLLVQKMENLRASTNHTISRLKINDAICADPFDHAAIETCKDVELNCRHKEWRQLLDIQETIMRIDRGLFGICDHCGRRISSKRLQALPMSKLCLTCQQASELQQKRSGVKRPTEKISNHHA